MGHGRRQAALGEAHAGAAPGITFSKLTFWMKGPARLWYCESNHNFPLDVENYLMALKILLLSSKVDKIDILCQERCFFFSQWRCYLCLLNTKVITINNSMQIGGIYKQRGAHGNEIMNTDSFLFLLLK